MKNHRQPYLGIVLILSFLAISACQEPPPPAFTDTAEPTSTDTTASAVPVQHYEDLEIGFALDYPKDWRIPRETLRQDSQVGNPNFVTQVAFGEVVESRFNGLAVTVNRLKRSVRENELEKVFLGADSVFAQIAGQAGGALVSKDRVKLGGRTAGRYVLNFLKQGIPYTSESVVMFRNDL